MQQITGWMPTKKVITVIDTEDEYREAMNRFLQIGGEPKSEEELLEMYRLMELMEEYEQDNCPYN
jgi:hypothetical protein